MATTPTSAIPVAPTPMGPGNFLPLVLSSIKAFIIKSIPSFCLFLVNSCCALYFFSGSTFVEVALTSQFEVGSSSTTVPDLASEAASFFADSTCPRPMTLILWTSVVLELLIWTFMAFGFLGSALPTWRKSITAVGTLSKDFSLADSRGSTSLSY